jgi:hypothetical protein
MKSPTIKVSLLALGLGLQMMLSGCSTTSDLTVLSSKVVRLNDFELDKADRKDAYGEDVRHWFLCIPFGPPPTMKEALDRGLEAGGGDVFTDVRVENWGWSIIIYSQGGWSVKGTVVKTRN